MPNDSDSRTDRVVAVYDLNSNTRTFDFAYFLAGAECFAKLHGRQQFELLIVQHDPTVESMRNAEFARANKATQRWRFENILLPLINLCPACAGHAYLPLDAGVRARLAESRVYPEGYDGRAIPGLDHGEVCALVNRAGGFVGLRASPLAGTLVDRWRSAKAISKPLVTITLREYPYDTARNSNVPEWLKFARDVRCRGYEPVIVPDNYRLFDHNDYGGCQAFPEAALHMDLRAALYEQAALNFFVPNGPTALGLLNPTVNYVEIKMLVRGSHDSSDAALRGRGTAIGQRSYFDVPTESYQVLSWRDDTYEEIRLEFDLFERSQESRARA